MNGNPQQSRDYRFAIGLLTGAVIGAGVGIWLAPLAAELGGKLADSAKTLRKRASERYEQASDGVGEMVNGITRKGQDVRDDLADAVARGAHEVERFATAAKSGRT